MNTPSHPINTNATQAQFLAPETHTKADETQGSEQPGNDNNSEAIAKLNDLARQAMGIACRLTMTDGIRALSDADRSSIRQKVELYAEFNDANNPYGERDFGKFEHEGEMVFWKIDYFDKALQFASPNPADPSVTTRVLTIMLAWEY